MPNPCVRRLAVAALATLVAAPVAVAKPSKHSKAARKHGDAAEIATFRLVRPENAGIMNLIPAHIGLDPESGVLSLNVTHLRPAKKAPQGLVLVGGDMAALSLRPGTYSLHVTTPVADQPRGYPGKPHVWQSPTVKVVLSRGETICLVLEPGIQGADYDGSWAIGKAESPADCGSMTEKVQPDEDGIPTSAPAAP